jgi:hypothetical protein
MRWWPWFRMYTNVVDNPKVRMLPEHMQARWLFVLAVAARHGGTLPEVSQVAFSLRLSVEEMQRTLDELVAAGLMDRSPEGWRPHDWEQWQAPSDHSSERVKLHREMKRRETVSITASETDIREKKRGESSRDDTRPPASRTSPTLENILDWQAFFGARQN